MLGNFVELGGGRHRKEAQGARNWALEAEEASSNLVALGGGRHRKSVRIFGDLVWWDNNRTYERQLHVQAGHEEATSQTPTTLQPGRRVLLLRLAKTAYAGLQESLRARKASCGGHLRGRQPRTPLATLGNKQKARQPRGPHSPTLGRRRRKRPLLTAHPQRPQLHYKAPRRGGGGGLPGRLALQTNTQSLLQLFGHHSGYSCQGKNGPDGAKRCWAEAPTTGFEAKPAL